MAVIYLQRIADGSGTLAPVERAFKLPAGWTIIDHPFESLAGAPERPGELTGYLELVEAPTAAGPFTFPYTELSPGLAQVQEPGTGSDDPVAMTIQAQRGQQQTGTNLNNTGGDLNLLGGAAGTGGSGAAGGVGAIVLQGGDVTIITAFPSAGNASDSTTLSTGSLVFQQHDGVGPSHLHVMIQYDGNGLVLASSTGAKLGFHSATPVVQASRVGVLTDSTGGTVSTTLAAITAGTLYAQADMVAAKNAIASLAAKLNAAELVLHNLGLTA